MVFRVKNVANIGKQMLHIVTNPIIIMFQNQKSDISQHHTAPVPVMKAHLFQRLYPRTPTRPEKHR